MTVPLEREFAQVRAGLKERQKGTGSTRNTEPALAALSVIERHVREMAGLVEAAREVVDAPITTVVSRLPRLRAALSEMEGTYTEPFVRRFPGPCESGFDCGSVASGVYVWSWGSGDDLIRRIVCEDCASRGRTAIPALLDATPPVACEHEIIPEHGAGGYGYCEKCGAGPLAGDGGGA